MGLKAISVRLDEETLHRIEQMADAMDRPRAWLMTHAIKQFVEREEWFITQIKEGVAAADAGDLVDHAEVRSKWEARRASKVD
jgi:predicted transcriptional regulator